MKKNKIRALALLIVRRGDEILIPKSHDSVKDEYFFRPYGGGIEFGETSKQALKREIIEELGAEIKNERLLGVLENFFEYEGEKGHEIIFVYEAEFVDEKMYKQEEFKILDKKEDFDIGKWEKIVELEKANFYPKGIVELLK